MLNKIILSIFLGVVTTLGVFAADDIVVGDGYSTKDNIIPAEEECIPDKTVCTQNSQCIENLECLQNQNTKNCYRCECNNGFEAVKGYCVKECEYGFTRNKDGICVNLCNDDVSTCGKLVCDESVLPNRAVCIKNYSPKGGVLICDDYDLRGTCIIYNKSINFSELPFYPKSLKPFKGCREESWYGWEVYIPEGINGEYAENYMLYSDNEMINLNDEVINSELLREKIIIQPKNYDTFRDFYGSSVHYVEIGYCDANCDDGNPTTTHYRYKEVLLEGYYSTSSGHLFQLPTNMIKKINTYVYSNGESIDDEFFYPESFSNLLITENNNIDDGLLICNNILDSGGTIVDVDCRSLQYHAYYFHLPSKQVESSNWPKTNTNDSFIKGDNNLIYLNDEWEALICPQVDSQLKDCKKIEQGVTYENWSELGITLTTTPATTDFQLFLIIQPSNREKLEKLSGGNYTMLYADPNYSGNSIAYWKKGERYPTPIKRVRSILNKGDVNTYLNSNKIQVYNLNNEVKNDDNYLHTTDSTPWKFDDPTILSTLPETIFLVNKYKGDIENEGVLLNISYKFYNSTYYMDRILQGEINEDYSLAYTPLIDLIPARIKKFDVYPDWEAYICKDEEKKECKYFDSGYNQLTSLQSFLSNSTIKYMLIQPKDHQKMNQFYGHKEYKEDYKDVEAINGYIILYRNPDFEDCIDSNCKQKEIILPSRTNVIIGQDTIIKPNEIKAVRIVGNIGYEIYTADKVIHNTGGNNDIKMKYLVLTDVTSIQIKNSYIPTVIISDSQDVPMFGFSWGIYGSWNRYVNKQFYSSRSGLDPQFNDDWWEWYYFSEDDDANHIPSEAINKGLSIYNEYQQQNRDIDNGDLLFISAHGSWKEDINGNATSSSSVLGKKGGFSLQHSSNFEDNFGGAIGDYETEWLLLSTCNGLGGKGVAREKVLEAYSSYFINGLHGIGGFYNIAHFLPITDNYYKNDGANFFKDIYHYNTPISEIWVTNMYSNDIGTKRWAGYVAPGPCIGYKKDGKYIPSYVHDDHFWSIIGMEKRITLPDPNRRFIMEHGYCYFSGAHGDYPDYLFSDVITTSPNDEWQILTEIDQDYLNNKLLGSIIDFTQDSYNTRLYENVNKIKYGNVDFNNYIELENISETIHPEFASQESLISSLFKDNIVNVYDTIFSEVISNYNYNINSITVTYITDQHYSPEGSPDELSKVYEIDFKFNIAVNNHNFIENNEIIIGINPATYEITKIKSKILSLMPTETIDKDINVILENYIDGDKENNGKYYSRYVKIGDDYTAIIFKKYNDSNKIEMREIF